MNDYTLTGSYTLPSLGKVYGDKAINPNITIRSMTTEEEMKRLNPSERPYKVMADIIDDCLVEKPGISAYDMCLGDYQFLLHKLRVITYGKEYAVSTTCPYCSTTNNDKIDLEQLEVFSYNSELDKYFEFDLPRTGHHIRLQMQTPRMLDDVSVRAKDIRKKSPKMVGDPAFLLTVESLIDTVDGNKMDAISKSEFVRHLPMLDTNHIIAYAQKLNERIGVNTTLDHVCDFCDLDYQSSFRTTSEFFRPTVNF